MSQETLYQFFNNNWCIMQQNLICLRNENVTFVNNFQKQDN